MKTLNKQNKCSKYNIKKIIQPSYIESI